MISTPLGNSSPRHATGTGRNLPYMPPSAASQVSWSATQHHIATVEQPPVNTTEQCRNCKQPNVPIWERQVVSHEQAKARFETSLWDPELAELPARELLDFIDNRENKLEAPQKIIPYHAPHSNTQKERLLYHLYQTLKNCQSPSLMLTNKIQQWFGSTIIPGPSLLKQVTNLCQEHPGQSLGTLFLKNDHNDATTQAIAGKVKLGKKPGKKEGWLGLLTLLSGIPGTAGNINFPCPLSVCQTRILCDGKPDYKNGNDENVKYIKKLAPVLNNISFTHVTHLKKSAML